MTGVLSSGAEVKRNPERVKASPARIGVKCPLAGVIPAAQRMNTAARRTGNRPRAVISWNALWARVVFEAKVLEDSKFAD